MMCICDIIIHTHTHTNFIDDYDLSGDQHSIALLLRDLNILSVPSSLFCGIFQVLHSLGEGVTVHPSWLFMTGEAELGKRLCTSIDE